MLTQQELQALVLVLQRAGLNPVEAVAIDAILRKLAPVSTPSQPQEEDKSNG